MIRNFQAVFSFTFVATVAAVVADFYSTTCVGLVHEPELPQELKK
ncbi:hypothetical protein GCM10023310_70030 [Paenibacillus vulneris]|uniref:Cyclic lactone autoinducer peptide n=1 Tax=Paenibacillus vulneris TaxID=1133364 RepID=A0ABW3UGY1_9BACL